MWWLTKNWHIVLLGWGVLVRQPGWTKVRSAFVPIQNPPFCSITDFWWIFLETNSDAVCFNGPEAKNSHSTGLEAGMPKSVPLFQFVLKQGGEVAEKYRLYLNEVLVKRYSSVQPRSCFCIIKAYWKNTHVEKVVLSTCFRALCETRYSHLHSTAKGLFW